jgi:hypothetical protein
MFREPLLSLGDWIIFTQQLSTDSLSECLHCCPDSIPINFLVIDKAGEYWDARIATKVSKRPDHCIERFLLMAIFQCRSLQFSLGSIEKSGDDFTYARIVSSHDTQNAGTICTCLIIARGEQAERIGNRSPSSGYKTPRSMYSEGIIRLCQSLRVIGDVGIKGFSVLFKVRVSVPSSV